jgi:hypothetical protein
MDRRQRTRSPVPASLGVSAARPSSIPGTDLCVSPGIYSQKIMLQVVDVHMKPQWYSDVPRRLRSSVELRQSLEECVMCIVARSSMRTGEGSRWRTRGG